MTELHLLASARHGMTLAWPVRRRTLSRPDCGARPNREPVGPDPVPLLSQDRVLLEGLHAPLTPRRTRIDSRRYRGAVRSVARCSASDGCGDPRRSDARAGRAGIPAGAEAGSEPPALLHQVEAGEASHLVINPRDAEQLTQHKAGVFEAQRRRPRAGGGHVSNLCKTDRVVASRVAGR